MIRPEAEKLLGGFATGTLTEAEKSLLYSAALEDQALFDALADEEVLRELLADPEVREQLLKALAPPPRAWWKRPALLGLAAALLLVVTTRRLLRPEIRRTEAQALPLTVPASLALPAGEGSAAKAKAAPRTAPPSRRNVPAPPAPSPETPMSAAIAPEAPQAAGGVLGNLAAPAAKAERRLAKTQAPAREPFSDGSAPAWALERLEGGRLRLRVTRGAGHLYLVIRGPEGARLVEPLAEGREEGRTLSTFEWNPGPGEAADLYLLPQPAAEPEGLPAEGPLRGWRDRVWPPR